MDKTFWTASLIFFIMNDKTDFGLTEEILRKVEKFLNMKNCRGQSHDNGDNMAGIYKWVQSRILPEHKLAYFMSYVSHSLNLVGVHAAESLSEAQKFFGTLNYFCFFFSLYIKVENLNIKTCTTFFNILE